MTCSIKPTWKTIYIDVRIVQPECPDAVDSNTLFRLTCGNSDGSTDINQPNRYWTQTSDFRLRTALTPMGEKRLSDSIESKVHGFLMGYKFHNLQAQP